MKGLRGLVMVGEAAKKLFFNGPATKALPPPSSSLVATFFLSEFFSLASKKFFFLSGPAFTTPPPLWVVRPLKKDVFPASWSTTKNHAGKTKFAQNQVSYYRFSWETIYIYITPVYLLKAVRGLVMLSTASTLVFSPCVSTRDRLNLDNVFTFNR